MRKRVWQQDDDDDEDQIWVHTEFFFYINVYIWLVWRCYTQRKCLREHIMNIVETVYSVECECCNRREILMSISYLIID